MKILITGATGFIGSFMVEAALEAHMEVWAARRSTSNCRYLKDPRLHFFHIDLGDDAALSSALDAHVAAHGAWDAVIHAAGATKCRNPQDFHRINTEGTLRLARLLVERNALKGRFVFISSLSVMGAIREKKIADSASNWHYAPILDTDTPNPNTAYGRSKWQAEQGLAKIAGLDHVILRPTGVYGPRERDYFLMARSICRHVDFSVGFRPQELTFIYVRDLVSAAFLAITRGTVGKSYFLTDGQVYSSRTFSDLLQKEMQVRHLLHIKAPLWFLRLVCLVSGKVAGWTGRTSTLNPDKYQIMKQRNWQCDITPARTELGFIPQYPLETGVAETVAWYRQEKWI